MEAAKSPLIDGDTRGSSIILPALQKLLQRAYSEDTDEQLQVSFIIEVKIGFEEANHDRRHPVRETREEDKKRVNKALNHGQIKHAMMEFFYICHGSQNAAAPW